MSTIKSPKPMDPVFIQNLPSELIIGGTRGESVIGDYLSEAEKYRLARLGNGRFYALFKAPASHYVHDFLLAVVRGEEATVVAMLEQNPSLLLETVPVTDYSGRKFKARTAFQLMLSAGDTDMIEAVKPYFAKLKAGEREQARQFYEQFPHGMEEEKPESVFDFTNIQKAITDATDEEVDAALKHLKDAPLCNKLNQFREDFDQCSREAMHFNPHHLLKAYAIYVDNYPNWSEKQRDLFWSQIVGYVQRYLPACYAQAYCSGLGSIVKGKKLIRELIFYYGPPESRTFFYGTNIEAQQLGFNCAATSRRRCEFRESEDPGYVRRNKCDLEEYVKQKQGYLQKLNEELAQYQVSATL